MAVRTWRRGQSGSVLLAALLGMCPWPAGAEARLYHEVEPNDTPAEAGRVSLPAEGGGLRMLGELDAADQDGYRFTVDADAAGRRWNVRLSGPAGALTKVDVFALEDPGGATDGPSRRQPRRVWTLSNSDGVRPVQADALLLSPGDYLLGVSQAGAHGAYSVAIMAHDRPQLTVVDAEDPPPLPLSLRRPEAFWVSSSATFEIALDTDAALEHWDLSLQSSAGREAEARLVGGDGAELLRLATGGDGLVSVRRGLALAPGAHRLQVEVDEPDTLVLEMRRSAAAAGAGREVEPNDEQPNAIEIGQDLAGTFEDRDEDIFVLSVGADAPRERVDLTLTMEPETAEARVCLVRDSIDLEHCRRAAGTVVLPRLGLTAGEYRLELTSRGPTPAPWRLEWSPVGPLRPGEEAEPNDFADQAVALAERGFGRGRFDGDRERDYWRIQATGAAQLWRLQLQGQGLHELTLEDASGNVLARSRAAGGGRVRLDNVFLTPGEYFAVASGSDGDYVLRLVELGAPPPGMELEPNDVASRASRLVPGTRHTGTLAAADDVDLYRFSLLGHERIGLTVRPPADGGIRGRLLVGDYADMISDIRHGREPGRELAWDLFLPPGDYGLELSPGSVSDAEYEVALERLPWFEPVADREPNDVPDRAAPLPADGIVQGGVGSTAAREDWFRLPPTDRPVTIELPRQRGLRLELVAAGALDEDLLQRDGDVERATLQPGRVHWLKIAGEGRYAFDLGALTDVPGETDGLAVELEVHLDSDRVQAFSIWEQRVGGTLRITNPGDQPRAVPLQTHLSAAAWALSGVPERVRVEPAGSLEVPFEVIVPADAAAAWPVRLAVLAGTGSGARSAMASIVVDPAVTAVEPRFDRPVPESLRGGINAARTAHGAAVAASPNVDADQVEDVARLFDGLVEVGHWSGFAIPTQGRSRDRFGRPTVRLAGDGMVPVRGFVLDPTAALAPTAMLERFAVELSEDGERFTEVLRGELQSLAREQFFELDATLPARYARLVPLSVTLGQADAVRAVRLGEFKVVAEPGWQPFDGGANLADPKLGGHLVRAAPWLRGSTFETGMLDPDEAAPAPRLGGAEGAQLVLGFHESRAARAARLVIDLPASGATRPSAVTVDTSIEGPTGAWQTLGRLALDAGRSTFELEGAPWVRYLRLRFDVPAEADRVQLPDRIQVLEAEPGEGYLSILGEWGRDHPDGPLEMLNEPQAPEAAPSSGGSRDTAVPLEAATPVVGRARLGEYSAWYRIDVPPARNSLALRAAGIPMLEAEPRLYDAAGDAVTLHGVDAAAAGAAWQAFVEPGATYFLEMAEPQRSVIFSWDTSGSVSAYLPFIANALSDYAGSVRSDRDAVNLVPFGTTQPLLERWLSHAYPLRKLLGAYAFADSSSAAEQALAVSARALESRPGKRVVILLTDAATSTYEDLWPALEAARPQVFALGLSSGEGVPVQRGGQRDLMQDWARVNGGHYDFVTGLEALARGFDRAIARLQRPVDFSVKVSFDAVEQPGPASLTVTAAEQPTAAAGAVEIILDASGSMLQRLDGERRIDIAKAAVTRSVAEALPDGVPLALRVYGHREAGACRTDLEVPLQPLDKAQLLDRVAGIEAVNLARTPIAESLAAVASDLADAEGRRLVVLLSDGEETCGGDPAAEIERLRDAGLDVRLNIVGFALDDAPTRRDFRAWARAGGGRYLDAGDAAGLQAALADALRVPFTVLDDDGEPVAVGRVGGEPLELPPGRYDVRVESATPRLLRDVELAPGERRELSVR